MNLNWLFFLSTPNPPQTFREPIQNNISFQQTQHQRHNKTGMFTVYIGRSPGQEDEYSLACIGQLTIGEHLFF